MWRPFDARLVLAGLQVGSIIIRNKDSMHAAAVAFGDAITADHSIINEDDKSRTDDRVACVIMDRGTTFTMGYPSKHKSATETRVAFQRYLGAANP